MLADSLQWIVPGGGRLGLLKILFLPVGWWPGRVLILPAPVP